MFTSFLIAIFIFVLLLLCLYKCLYNYSNSPVKDLSSKYVLITGCGSGFGLLAAQRLDQLGFNVFASCRTRSGEDNVQRTCSNRVRTFTLDVTSKDDITKTFNEIKKEIPHDKGLWGLINNAGVLQVGPIEWQPLDCFQHTVDVNLWGTIAVTKTFLPLIKRAKGRVINMGSTLCRLALPYMTSYTISKYGVDAFTDSLRREMSPWKIHVVNIEAGGHRTKLVSGTRLAEQWSIMWDELNDEIKQEYAHESANEGAEEMLRFDSVMSYHCDDVVDAMVTALTSQVPKSRYVVGLDAKAFMFLSMLPSSLIDWLISLGIKPLKPKAAITSD